MYTLDGRMRFDLSLSDEDFNRFKTWKLHEVILSSVGSKFTLNFSFVDGKLAKGQEFNIEDGSANVLPEYVIVDQRALLPAGDVLATLPAPNQVLLQTTTIVQPVVANELHLELNASRGFAQSVKTMPQGMSLNMSTTQLNLNIQHQPNPNGQPKGLGVAQANNNKSGANS
jgi:hypothetical protein